LNHLVRLLREDYRTTPEYRKAAHKESFDNWHVAISVLRGRGTAASTFNNDRDYAAAREAIPKDRESFPVTRKISRSSTFATERFAQRTTDARSLRRLAAATE
jgi:hypothetical protein